MEQQSGISVIQVHLVFLLEALEPVVHRGAVSAGGFRSPGNVPSVLEKKFDKRCIFCRETEYPLQ
jgi:hypothetical protein